MKLEWESSLRTLRLCAFAIQKSYSQFGEDGAGGGGGVGGFEYRAADYDVARAGAGGFGGGHDALLVVATGFAGGTDAGGDELDVGGKLFAEHGDFERGADEAAEAGVDRELTEAGDLDFRGGGDADFAEAEGVHRGEDGDAEEEKVGLGLLLGGAGGGHHFASAAGVEREHADGQRGEGFDGFGDGVWDVVELEVEEDVEALVGDGLHVVGAVGGEHLEADFDPAKGAAQLAENRGGLFAGGDVEGEDQIAGHWFRRMTNDQ